MQKFVTLVAIATFSMATSAWSAESIVVGFDGGDNEGFVGNALFEATDGNPGGAARHVSDSFFNELRTGDASAGFRRRRAFTT